MQRDFLEPGGFGAALGNDVSRLKAAGGPCADVLAAARRAGILIIHTREGHRADLTDAPPIKVERGDPAMRIGARGQMARILVRGEPGHDIIPELYPAAGEPVIDKPGKGAFYQTDLDLMLRNRGIGTLFVCGVTTEVCVNTTLCGANDRGYRCVALSACCASYFQEFHDMGLKMIKAQGGIFGWVASSAAVLKAMQEETPGNLKGGAPRGAEAGRPPQNRISSRRSGRRATGTRSSGSAPTSSSTCWC